MQREQTFLGLCSGKLDFLGAWFWGLTILPHHTSLSLSYLRTPWGYDFFTQFLNFKKLPVHECTCLAKRLQLIILPAVKGDRALVLKDTECISCISACNFVLLFMKCYECLCKFALIPFPKSSY